jgi:mevalonate kinase
MSALEEKVGTGIAHGKIILLGEHSVVYGRPALAAGLPNGARARAWITTETSTLSVKPWGVTVKPDRERSLSEAFAKLLEVAQVSFGVCIEAELEIPGGSGLGSSAALGVAVLRALDSLRGIERDEASSLECSLAWERVFHGNPSGVDNAMAIAGGLAQYVRGEGIERVRARKPLTLVVGDSGEPCSTKITVDNVARQHEKNRERMEKHFDAIAVIVRNARLALEAGDMPALGQLFDMNQSLLAGMLVSTATLEEMIGAARNAGALGAKLTGGGGGGCMIALAADPTSANKIKDAIEALGKRAFIAVVGESKAV